MWDGRLVSTSVVCACLSPWLLVFVVCVCVCQREIRSSSSLYSQMCLCMHSFADLCECVLGRETERWMQLFSV